MQFLRKDPLRIPRYIALLLRDELLRGSADKRRRFISRVVRRVSQKAGLYKFAEQIYMSLYVLMGRNKAVRHWMWATFGLSNRDYLRAWIAKRYECGPKIVVIGMGSIGDILQITPV